MPGNRPRCAAQLTTQLGDAIPPSRIHCVINGVREAPPGDRAAIRREWQCNDRDVVLGCLARIEHQKDPLFLVGLLPDLPEQVRLVWLGDGSLATSCWKRRGGWACETAFAWKAGGVMPVPALPGSICSPCRHDTKDSPWRYSRPWRRACLAWHLPWTVRGRQSSMEKAAISARPMIAKPGSPACAALMANESQRGAVARSGRKRYLECFSLEAMAKGTVNAIGKYIGAYMSRAGQVANLPGQLLKLAAEPAETRNGMHLRKGAVRVLHIIQTLDPAAGGPPHVVTRLAAAQAQLGLDVHLAYYGDSCAAEYGAAYGRSPVSIRFVAMHWSRRDVGNG